MRYITTVATEDSVNRAPAAELIWAMFTIRNIAHIEHLQTSSFARHKALDEYYNRIIELADDFAEAYQGNNGVIQNYPSSCDLPMQAGAAIQRLFDFIVEIRQTISSHSHIQNIIDEIQALNSSTLYKLNTLT